MIVKLELDEQREDKLGNKGKFLLQMKKKGFNVPGGFILDTDIYDEVIAANSVDFDLFDRLKKLDKGLRYGGFMSIDGYNDDLTYNGLSFSSSPSCCDIVAVYSPEDLTSLDFATQHLNLIWKRPEEVVMTISEIEKKLGITNLKIVKEGDE